MRRKVKVTNPLHAIVHDVVHAAHDLMEALFADPAKPKKRKPAMVRAKARR